MFVSLGISAYRGCYTAPREHWCRWTLFVDSTNKGKHTKVKDVRAWSVFCLCVCVCVSYVSCSVFVFLCSVFLCFCVLCVVPERSV